MAIDQILSETLVVEIKARAQKGARMRDIAKALGVSRSFVQRSLYHPLDPIKQTHERELAGGNPLPVGHPLSWNAISATPFPL